MASCKESDMTPGTSFAGTLPANGLTPSVPGMAWPGVLELVVAPDCAKDSVVPYRKTPASKSMQLSPKLSFTGASSTSHLVQRLCQGKYAIPADDSGQPVSAQRVLD